MVRECDMVLTVHIQESGAAGIVVFNHVYSSRWKVAMFVGDNVSVHIPAVFISKEYGSILQLSLQVHNTQEVE